MHIPQTDIETQLRFTQSRREAQMQRSQLRAYLAATRTRPSFAFRARRGVSKLLFTMAGMIKPSRPNKRHSTELWVPKRLPVV